MFRLNSSICISHPRDHPLWQAGRGWANEKNTQSPHSEAHCKALLAKLRLPFAIAEATGNPAVSTTTARTHTRAHSPSMPGVDVVAALLSSAYRRVCMCASSVGLTGRPTGSLGGEDLPWRRRRNEWMKMRGGAKETCHSWKYFN